MKNHPSNAAAVTRRIASGIAAQPDIVARIVKLHSEEPGKLTLLQIAETVLEIDDVLKYPNIFSRAVGKVLRQELGPEHMDSVNDLWRRKVVRSIGTKVSLSDAGKKGARRRHEIGPKMDPDALLRAKGIEPRTDEELARVLELCSDAEFLHTSGAFKGKPDLRKIATQINLEFFDSREVRTRNSINRIRTEQSKLKSE